MPKKKKNEEVGIEAAPQTIEMDIKCIHQNQIEENGIIKCKDCKQLI